MKKKKEPFSPNDFDSITTIKEIAPQFEQLFGMDFKKVSLAQTIIPLNLLGNNSPSPWGETI